jgi:heptose I phosphotransferase
MMLWLDEPFKSLWKNRDAFCEVQTIDGTVYRDKEGRKTLRFEVDGQGYFLKIHRGIGWREIVKNLLQLRLPVLGASEEYNAIRKLESLRLQTMTPVGFGRCGINPAAQQSFLITRELIDIISLEDYCRHWKTKPPSLAEKQTLIRRVAHIARNLHQNGINHRDFYLCHFLLSTSVPDLAAAPIYLIDLHRAQLRKKVPRRWLIKDLGALLYSALDIGLTRADIDLFITEYDGNLQNDAALCAAIKQRAASIYRRDFGREPQWPQ